MRGFVTIGIALGVTFPGLALAQPPAPPSVEVGVQASIQIEQEAARAWSPRITLNLTPTTALEGTADIRPAQQTSFARLSGQAYSLHWRQTLFTSGRWQVFGVLGAGGGRLVHDVPDIPDVSPAYTYVDSGLAAHLGPAVQFEAARWLALRADLRLTAGNGSGIRGMVGAVVPLGRFRAGDRPAGGKAPLAAWGRVTPGREVWVTTSTGALVHGEVSAFSDTSVTLRRQRDTVNINLADVTRVEGRDSLRNGITIGGISGAASGAALIAWAASVICETDSCDQVAVVAMTLGAASGAAIGGLVGAMVDSLLPGRQTLFEKTGVRVTPVVTARSKTIGVTVEWR